jgi:hypothetical protein
MSNLENSKGIEYFTTEPLVYATGKIGLMITICTFIRKIFALNSGWAIVYPERSSS